MTPEEVITDGHVFDRTSPKGGPFEGVCRFCGVVVKSMSEAVKMSEEECTGRTNDE